MELGPFKITISDHYSIEAGGLDAIDLHPEGNEDYKESIELLRFVQSDHSVGKPNDERAHVSGGEGAHIEWKVDLLTNKSGIWSMVPTITKVTGTIIVEALPDGADPSDPDAEFEEHEVSFTTESEGWQMEYDDATWKDVKISNEIYPTSVDIQFDSKKIIIGF